MKPIEEVLRVRVELELELTHGVAAIGKKGDLLVHLMALRVERLEGPGVAKAEILAK